MALSKLDDLQSKLKSLGLEEEKKEEIKAEKEEKFLENEDKEDEEVKAEKEEKVSEDEEVDGAIEGGNSDLKDKQPADDRPIKKNNDNNNNNKTFATAEEKLSYKAKVQSLGNPLIYDPNIHGNDLKKFDGYKPSQIYLKDGYSAVIIPFPRAPIFPEMSEEDTYSMKSDFKNMEFQEHKIQELANKYGLMTGKWMIIGLEWKRLDIVWQTLINAIFTNKIPFGAGIIQLEVAARDDADDNPHNRSRYGVKINVRTLDYTNYDQVDEIETILRKLGVTETLQYKPDVYTKLDILSLYTDITRNPIWNPIRGLKNSPLFKNNYFDLFY